MKDKLKSVIWLFCLLFFMTLGFVFCKDFFPVSAHKNQDIEFSNPELKEDFFLAKKIQESVSWGKISENLFREYILPYKILDENAELWRKTISKDALSLIKNEKTSREACLKIIKELGKFYGIYYTKNRRKPNMSAMEAIREKKVSCTGQSIFLVSALRSVGIPARIVGVASWNHLRGNHTWAEAYLDGKWEMVALDEGFNPDWVLEWIGMLDLKNPMQHIYAQGSDSKKEFYPTFNSKEQIPAIDVSERYMNLAREWYKKKNILDINKQRLFIETKYEGKRIALNVEIFDAEKRLIVSGKTPSDQEDMRKFLKLEIPRNQILLLCIKDDSSQKVIYSQEIKANESVIQILQIDIPSL